LKPVIGQTPTVAQSEKHLLKLTSNNALIVILVHTAEVDSNAYTINKSQQSCEDLRAPYQEHQL